MSNVRISDQTHSTFRGLADLEGQSLQAVLDKAIECYRFTRFWDEVETAAGSLGEDQSGRIEELGEHRAWEATVADGLAAA
jgi:hypothetical protein